MLLISQNANTLTSQLTIAIMVVEIYFSFVRWPQVTTYLKGYEKLFRREGTTLKGLVATDLV